ncbi:MAG TPA: GTPase [Rhodospirillaceae bacterium]|nr:GTPase [Rhodospirillaceae bacterium]
MRLKSFYGANMTEAMRQVREALGDDAIIVATRDDENGGVRVTAAVDDPVLSDSAPSRRPSSVDTVDSESIDLIAQALVAHHVPLVIAEKLLATATQYANDDPLLSIGAALDTHFKYAPLYDETLVRPLILIGPPGAGKTLCAAKIATQLTLQKKDIAVISTDTERAGGMAQLGAFTRLLKTDLIEIEDPHALRDAIGMQKNGTTVIIDTAGCNPLAEADRQYLTALIKAANAAPVLVLPADLDVHEATDMAAAFQKMGASRLLPTRLDMTRRLGGMLCVAYETHLPFCHFSASGKVTEAPQPLNPVSLARLILPKKAEQPARAKAQY